MRVLVVNRYWKRSGGVEEVVRDIVALLEQRGHEVVPFAMSDPENWDSEWSGYFPKQVEFPGAGGVTRARSLARAVLGRDARHRLGRLLDDVEIDVAHVFNVYHYLGTGVLTELRRRRVSVVLSLHDYKVGCPNVTLFSDHTGRPCTVCLEQPGGYAWAPPVMRCRSNSVSAGLVLAAEAVTAHARGAYQRGPAAVTVVNSLQQVAAERAGVERTRIHRIPNFVEIADPLPAQRDGHVLYVGRLVREKGVDVLLDACGRADLPLRVVGDGPLRQELETAAIALGIGCTFVGSISRADALQEMRRASVVAVPSLWPEVFSLVAVEAWSMGAPVVGSAIGGLGELLSDDRGIRCAPGDAHALAEALRGVIEDPGGAARLVARGRAYARAELSRERWIERLQAAYAAAGARL